jgi:hypothetical protein
MTSTETKDSDGYKLDHLRSIESMAFICHPEECHEPKCNFYRI